MPKNNGVTVTYEGHSGVVENAVGQRFELDPTRDLEGNDNEGLDRADDYPDPKPIDGPDQGASENTDGREQAERADTDKDGSDNAEGEREGDRPSAGDSSKESSQSPAKSAQKTTLGPKLTARATGNR